MKNRFAQHIPTFVDMGGSPPPSYEFDGADELLLLDVVKKYSTGRDFSHFAMSDNLLMVIRDDGFEWWVVGYIQSPEDIDLPQWEGGKYRTSVGVRTDVVSKCGDDLTLADGRMVKNIGKRP